MMEIINTLSGILAFLGGILTPIITILIGLILLKVEDIFVGLGLGDDPTKKARLWNIVPLIKIIGMIKIAVGALYLISRFFRF